MSSLSWTACHAGSIHTSTTQSPVEPREGAWCGGEVTSRKEVSAVADEVSGEADGIGGVAGRCEEEDSVDEADKGAAGDSDDEAGDDAGRDSDPGVDNDDEEIKGVDGAEGSELGDRISGIDPPIPLLGTPDDGGAVGSGDSHDCAGAGDGDGESGGADEGEGGEAADIPHALTRVSTPARPSLSGRGSAPVVKS
ncbi:hypothetical protein KEM60_00201 [Austwickia sp. TVS 96-490-7B]|nr:hypothetical protein [Austwickia sp. TVS 96-490-7B]